VAVIFGLGSPEKCSAELPDCNCFSWVKKKKPSKHWLSEFKVSRMQLFFMGQVSETHSYHWYSEFKIRRLQLFFMGQVSETHS
jgi:hypothetical protein